MQKIFQILVVLFLIAGLGCVFSACCCNDDDDNETENSGLAVDQRIADFEHLVHMVNKYYGPLKWKKDGLGCDILEAAETYRAKIYETTDDLAFFDLMFGYIAEFQDGHTGFSIPSTYRASLNFAVDLYEGKLLVDRIYDSTLQLSVGDEILTMDGEQAEDLITRLRRYLPSGFELCSQRWATTLVTNRSQELIPEVVSGPVTLEIKSQDGTKKTITLQWETSGTPYFSGYYDDPFDQANRSDSSLLDRLQRIELPPKRADFLINLMKYGHRAPSFTMPDSFNQRLGTGTDEFFSGTYSAEGKTIGFLRVPKMYVNKYSSMEVLKNELIALDQITDGLVIDIMDNPGGQVDFCNFLARHLHRNEFPQILFEMRPTWELIISIESALNGNLPETLRAFYEYLYDELVNAYTTDKLLTDPISLDGTALGLMMPPAQDSQGNPIGYSKPIIILINELSISGGDYFPATMKDSGRAKLVGMRTAGGGGHVVGYYYEFPYSETAISLTGSLMYRYKPEDVPGYPQTHYIENVGVHPHIEYDYQNVNDLLQGGQHYVVFFTQVILDEINH